MLLSSQFLAQYVGDPFRGLLARATYLSKYCRGGESWSETVRRVVEGNCEGFPVSSREAEALYDTIWHMRGLPPGRGLWAGGVPGIPVEARFNCWYTSVRTLEDWCWAADNLMLGGGVGVGLRRIGELPLVRHGVGGLAIMCSDDHPDLEEISPDVSDCYSAWDQRECWVDDSREGWVQALRSTLRHAFAGETLTLDVSDIRPRGAPIRTFGGVASGPGPLVELLRSVYALIRKAAGRKLTSVECGDITNFIGKCVKSGNVRRSALLLLGSPTDQDFRDAKKDWSQVTSHRHTSNNSIAFESSSEIANFDWKSLVEDNAVYGEPGIANLHLVRKTDPLAKGPNPCGEQFLEDREACNLAEVFPALIPFGQVERVAALMARYAIRQRVVTLTDAESDAVGRRNMRIGLGLGGLCDFRWSRPLLSGWYRAVRTEANEYASELGVRNPITVTTVKPSGTISLLNGSSPGLHAPYAPHYIRRIRLATNDPMSAALAEANVPFEHDVYDNSGKTLCFEFPMSAPNARATVQTETIRQQFERQVAVQESWADNAVSATLSFREDEKEELASLLAEYVPRLKSTSCLPKAHGYAQAPYEAIQESNYRERVARINHNHPLVGGGEILDSLECEGGACPVR